MIIKSSHVYYQNSIKNEMLKGEEQPRKVYISSIIAFDSQNFLHLNFKSTATGTYAEFFYFH